MTRTQLSRLFAGRHRSRRGTTLVSYGLVVGLISVASIAAITDVGSEVNDMFAETEYELIGPSSGTGAIEEVPGVAGAYTVDLEGHDAFDTVTIEFTDTDEPIAELFIGNRYELRIRRSNRTR